MGLLRHHLRSRAGRRLQAVGHATGAMNVIAKVRRLRGGVILMYHSIADGESRRYIDPRNHVPPDVFEQQMAFLASKRSVLSLAALTDILRQGGNPPDGSVAITFDDGYLDNLTVAAPILKQYGFPATFFLPTGYIDRAESQWIDQAYSAFAFRNHNELVWRHGDRATRFDLVDQRRCKAAYGAVCDSLMTASPHVRSQLLAELNAQLQMSARLPQLTMSWHHVERLLIEYPGFAIGGHTIEHVDLTAMPLDCAVREVSNCRAQLDRRFGRETRAFSFPYGRATRELRQVVKEHGYSACCGGGPDAVVTSRTDPFAFRRVVAPPSMDRFGLLTNSANTGFWRRLGR